MRRVLLLYKDLNTQKLIHDRFEFEGFQVVTNYEQKLRAIDFDLIVREGDIELNLDKSFLELPIIKITSKLSKSVDSARTVYVKKPFRPSELVIKAKILLSGNQVIDIEPVKKSA